MSGVAIKSMSDKEKTEKCPKCKSSDVSISSWQDGVTDNEAFIIPVIFRSFYCKKCNHSWEEVKEV